MLTKVKKIFSSLTKRKVAFLVLIFVFLGVFVPLKLAFAGLAAKIAGALLGFVFWTAAMLSALFMGLTGALLNWVISPTFTTLPYTIPGDLPNGNPVIKLGLSITQGFVNIFLVLVLIYIALATILRFGGYETKKLLVTFILVALLVNFSPVICGLIVDASNIVMNFFLSQLTGWDVFLNTLKTQSEGYFANFKPSADVSWETVIATIIQLVVLTIINIFMGIAFFLFAGLFFVRRIVIWALVILSPLAFVSLILPGTKKRIWDLWWSNFLQWSLVGISSSFFLYLSLRTAALSTSLVSTPSTGILEGIGNSTLPYLVGLVFLYLGFTLAQQTSAMGAGAVMAYTKKGGKAVGKWGGKQTVGRFAASKRGEKFFKGMVKGRVTPTFREAKGFGKITAGAETLLAAPLRWTARYAGKKGLEYGAAMPKDIDKGVNDLEGKFGKDVDRAGATYKSILPTEWQDKIALAQYLAKTKGAKGLEKLDPKELKEAVELTTKYAPKKLEDIVKHKPELIEGITGEKDTTGELIKDGKIAALVQKAMISDGLTKDASGEYKDEDVKKIIEITGSEADAIKKAAFKKAVEAMKNEDVENLAISTIKNSDFQEMAVRFKSPSFIRKIGEEKGAEYITLLHQKAEELGAEEIIKTNPTLLSSAVTNPGFRAIFPPLKGAGTKLELKTLLEKRKKAPLPPPPSSPSIAKMEHAFEEGQKEEPKGMVKIVRESLGTKKEWQGKRRNQPSPEPPPPPPQPSPPPSPPSSPKPSEKAEGVRRESIRESKERRDF